ncbi:MAG TPA: transglutaminase domain-containing protein [Usitatibacter sp.]|jgi:transglutaminase-like putative cysteine protease|nr:transglutaminase domain-containing protein [Usitatibacter sp.]
MDRRDFLRLAGAASAVSALPGAISSAFAETTPAENWKVFEVTTRVEVLKPTGLTRVWVPTPLASDMPYQKSFGNDFHAEGGTSGITQDPGTGVRLVWAEWPAGVAPVLVHTQHFATRDVAIDFSRPGNAPAENPAVLARYTASSEHVPTTGLVKQMSDDMVKGQKNDIDKAHAIYEWIADNTYRDPKTRGCGTGDINFMLENKAWGGKCADLNALFVAFARAQGIPSRDVYGVRVAGSKLGYKSLGKTGGDITKAQHCRAEFYAAGYGWIPVDPADVRKVILEEDGGKKPDDPMVIAARTRLFGSWEMNWLAYNTGNDVPLPNAQRGKVAFLMYPQCETGGVRVDSLDADNFKYAISSKELA